MPHPQPSRHTPGPWTIEDREDRLLIWSDGRHDYIASLPADIDGLDSEEVAANVRKEQEANARLIAAAPDLLAALERIIGACAEEDSLESGSLHLSSGNAILKQARAAILAATGGKS